MSKKRWTIKTFGLSGIKEAPLEDGTLKDLKEGWNTIGLSEKGEKAEIKDGIEEIYVLEDSTAEENAEKAEEEPREVEDDSLEDWTVKEPDKDKKPELIVPCAENLVEVIDSDESANDLDVKTSSEPNWMTTAENSPRRASERAY